MIWRTGYGTVGKLLYRLHSRPNWWLLWVGCVGPGCDTPEGSRIYKNNKKKQKINSFHVLIGAPCLRHCMGQIIIANYNGSRRRPQKRVLPVTQCRGRRDNLRQLSPINGRRLGQPSSRPGRILGPAGPAFRQSGRAAPGRFLDKTEWNDYIFVNVCQHCW